MEEYTIYKITNKDKVIYIGCSRVFNKRKTDHLRSFKHSYSHSRNMYEHFQLDDIDIVPIECIYTTFEEARKIEQKWIEYYNTFKDGYNASPYGNTVFINHTEEFKNRQKNRMKINNPMFNEESKNKMKQKLRSHWTKEKRDEQSNRLKGRPNKNKGKNTSGLKVYMCDSNGNILKEFISVRVALNYLGVRGHVSLYRAIKNKTLYKGHYWKKEDCL